MSARASRRAVFAQVLLTASPKELSTQGENSIRVEFDQIAELKKWLADSGILAAEPDMLESERESVTDDGRTRRSMHAYPNNFHGWQVYGYAREYTDDVEPLDEQTREQLQAVADRDNAKATA